MCRLSRYGDANMEAVYPILADVLVPVHSVLGEICRLIYYPILRNEPLPLLRVVGHKDAHISAWLSDCELFELWALDR